MKLFWAILTILALLTYGCSSNDSGLARRMDTTARATGGVDVVAPDSADEPAVEPPLPGAGALPDAELPQPDTRLPLPPDAARPDTTLVLEDAGRPDSTPPDLRALPDTVPPDTTRDTYRLPHDTLPQDTAEIKPCPYDEDRGLRGPVICDHPSFCGQRCVYYFDVTGKSVCTCGGCGTPSRWQLTGC